MTDQNKTLLEKSGNNSIEQFAHSEPMSRVFQNIFMPPAQGSTKVQLPEEISTLVLNTNDAKYIPASHAGYCFRKDLLRSVLAFLMNPHGDALYLTGPTGSGKTSLVTEIFGRLRWPLQQLTMTERFEFETLRGSWVYRKVEGCTQPEMVFLPGPLAVAMKEGHGLLINEADIAPAGELSGLNDVIEGRPLMIPETGEIIHPHPLFRLVVTANSKGQGDESGLYAGIQQQNIAAMDRYRVLEVGYPAAAVEEGLLQQILGDSEVDRRVAHDMVELANRVRSQFVGLNPTEGTITVPVSTRCLTRWALLAQDFTGASNPLRQALNESLLNRCNEADAEAINAIALAIFGEQWNVPLD